MLKATLAVAFVAAIALAPAYGQEKHRQGKGVVHRRSHAADG